VTPQKEFALLNLARVYMKLGQKPEARAKLAQIQNPDYSKLKDRLNERMDKE